MALFVELRKQAHLAETMTFDDVHAGSAHHYLAQTSNEKEASEHGRFFIGAFVLATTVLLAIVVLQLMRKERILCLRKERNETE